MKAFDNQLAASHPRPMGVPANTVPLTTLEHWRDQMALRVARLCEEQDRRLVEGFRYADETQAARVRGRLMCSLLKSIDDVNRDICARIAPGFKATPSEGFSDRVSGKIRRGA